MNTKYALHAVTRLCLALMFIQAFTRIGEADDTLPTLNNHIQLKGAEILSDFRDFLSIPNVTGDLVHLEANADFIVRAFSRVGAKCQLARLEGKAPLILGELKSKNPLARTIGIYCHYDGQATGKAQDWTTTSGNPFSPTLFTDAPDKGGTKISFPAPDPNAKVDDNWRIYARGASDDKGPIYAFLKVLEFYQRHSIDPTVNVVFMFDGQEEGGSLDLGAYLKKNKTLLSKPQIWLICDGPMHQSGLPSLVFGARGYTRLEVTLYGAASGRPPLPKPLHSGHYGNWAPNPALRLAQLVAGMKDDAGKVLIPRFYDTMVPLTDEERSEIEAIPSVDRALLASLGLARQESTKSLEESINEPALNIIGFSSGGVGAETRSAIPAEATAGIEIRLVKGEDPQRMVQYVEQFIHSRGYELVREDPDMAMRLKYPKLAKCVAYSGYRAARTSMTDPLVQSVAEAVKMASGNAKVIRQPTMGGSLPLYLFEDVLERPFLLVPTVNYDNNQHAPNENMRIGNLWYGMRLFATLLSQSGEE